MENYAQVSGLKICYLDWGQQNPETIVFIHGLSGNVENWWDQFEYFRDSYRVVVPDLPGHGKSSKPDTFDYSVPAYARTIIELMDQLKIQKAVVVGNSLGGAIAGYIAINYPDRVDRLVLSDSAGIKISPLLKSVAPLATPLVIRWTGVTSGRQYSGKSPKDKARADFSASFRNTNEELPYLKAIDRSLSQIAKFDFSGDLAKIKAKTLIVWGDNDSTVPFKYSKTFKDSIPGSELYVVKDGGHTPNMLFPNEFNCAMSNFLKDKELKVCHEVGDTERKGLEQEKKKK
jgi:pimeloyl-ACP methyl ester carboxylesterase